MHAVLLAGNCAWVPLAFFRASEAHVHADVVALQVGADRPVLLECSSLAIDYFQSEIIQCHHRLLWGMVRLVWA